jgi:replicative DNA helicase
MHLEHGVKCIIIDYLQLLRSGSDNRNSNRENEVARISNGIKALAKELNVPIIVLAQLNRQAEDGEKGPKLSHLRESGSIEQDADIVMMLHRQRTHEADPHNRSPSIAAELIVAKHRNGPTGKINLLFFPALTRFRSDSRVSDEDVPR